MRKGLVLSAERCRSGSLAGIHAGFVQRTASTRVALFALLLGSGCVHRPPQLLELPSDYAPSVATCPAGWRFLYYDHPRRVIVCVKPE